MWGRRRRYRRYLKTNPRKPPTQCWYRNVTFGLCVCLLSAVGIAYLNLISMLMFSYQDIFKLFCILISVGRVVSVSCGYAHTVIKVSVDAFDL
jgi:hypothetical protein